jgi:hypothetical protein
MLDNCRELRDAYYIRWWSGNHNPGTAGNAISWTTAMTLDASGNLSNVGRIGFGATANKTALSSQVVTNITAGSAQNIYSTALSGNYGAYMMVIGVDAGNNWFCDYLTFLHSNSVVLLASQNGGAPGARAYSVVSGSLRLNPSVTQTTVRVSANEIAL